MPGLLRPGATLQVPRRLPIGSNLRVDWSHPLARGLIGCYVPGSTAGTNLAIGPGNGGAITAITPTNANRSITAEGPGWKTTVTDGLRGLAPTPFLNWTSCTLYWRGFSTSASTGGGEVYLGIFPNNSNGTPFYVAAIGYQGGTITAQGLWNTAGTFTALTYGSNLIGLGSLAATFTVGGNVLLYKNALQVGSVAFGAGAPTSAGPSPQIGFQGNGNAGAGTAVATGNIGFIWTRALSAAEITLLDNDPYCFLIAGEDEMSALPSTFVNTPNNPNEPLRLWRPNIVSFQPFVPPVVFPPGGPFSTIKPSLPARPKIDWSVAPRGLQRAFTNSDSNFPECVFGTSTKLNNPPIISSQLGPCLDATNAGALVYSPFSGSPAKCSIEVITYFKSAGTGICYAQFSDTPQSATNDRMIQSDATGRPSFYIFDGAQKTVTAATPMVAGNWYHIVGVADGSFIYIYVNGLLAAPPLPVTNGGVTYGAGPIFAMGNGSNNYAGTNVTNPNPILSTIMANQAWTADEVMRRYQNPFGFLQPSRFLLPNEPEIPSIPPTTAFFDVADNPNEPFILQPPNLSPALPFAIRTADTPVSPETPFPSLALPQPNLSPAQPFAIRIDNPTPTNQWWDQPLDLQRHPQQYDPNQSRLSYQDQATPSAFGFWTEPIDLERHPTQTDPNQSRVSYQDQATPTLFGFWTEPPDLLRHQATLDTNQGLDLWFSPLSLAPAITPSTWWWSQPTVLLWHPPQLDTNESRLVSQQFAEPAVWWYTQPSDLQFHPTHLDTNQSRIVNPTGWTPTAFFLLPQIDVQKHPPELFVNQPFVAFPQVLGLTPLTFGFWAQPLDLHRHPPHLDTNQQRLVYPDRWTPSSFGFWTEPVDLQRHATHLDTNQAFVFLPPLPGATPNILGFWAQPPDLLRHAASLDTNLSRVSFQNLATPSAFGFWAQPPDLMRHPSTLDTNEFRLVSQQFAEPGVWWWTQPQFQPPRAPDLWASQPYVAQGWQLTSTGLFVPVPAFMRPSAPNLAPPIPFVVSPAALSAVTPNALAFFPQPYLAKHPPELFTWQYRVGLVIPPVNATPDRASFFGQPQDLLRMPPAASILPWTYVPGSFRFEFGFFGSAFIATKSRLSQPATKARHNISAKTVSSLTSTNRIMQGFRKMSRSPDLSPPIVAGVEQEYVQFDFAPGLNPGIIIAAIVAVNVYSLTGNDPTPMARLLNTPAITASPSSLLASQGVVGLFGNMVAGLYLLQAIIQTSDGQVLSTEARWPCVSATP